MCYDYLEFFCNFEYRISNFAKIFSWSFSSNKMVANTDKFECKSTYSSVIW